MDKAENELISTCLYNENKLLISERAILVDSKLVSKDCETEK